MLFLNSTADRFLEEGVWDGEENERLEKDAEMLSKHIFYIHPDLDQRLGK